MAKINQNLRKIDFLGVNVSSVWQLGLQIVSRRNILTRKALSDYPRKHSEA